MKEVAIAIREYLMRKNVEYLNKGLVPTIEMLIEELDLQIHPKAPFKAEQDPDDDFDE